MRVVRKTSQNSPASQKNKIKTRHLGFRILGLVLFSLGVLLGLGILGLSVYADFEASLFDISYIAEKPIRPFTCPILIDSDEIGIVRATVKNDHPNRVQRTITGHFSQETILNMRESTYRVNFDPYEAKDMYWEISKEDAVYGHLILVKVYLFARLSNPARESGCGVLVFDLPGRFTGSQVVTFFLVLGVALMVGGGFLWWTYSSPRVGIRAEEAWGIASLMASIFVGLFFSYLGYFGFSVGLFYLAMLMVAVMIPHFIFSRLKA